MASIVDKLKTAAADVAGQVQAAVTPAPAVGTWDAADKSTEFKGYAVFSKKGDAKPWKYNPPKLADDFVEIAIQCCGICGSDIHTIDCGWGPTNFPVIVGHEIVGTVKAVGSSVKNVKVGDRVGVGAQCGACLSQDKAHCIECSKGQENHCRTKMIQTYNSKYPDGQVSQGGYAEHVRCQSDFAFKLPEAISSQEAAPLMCAGVTVFAPLHRHMKEKNMKVAIVGVGGLGHLALQYAAKLQDGTAEVTAISHNSKKKAEAMKLGATQFLDTSDEAQVKAAFRKFDLILSTANGSELDIGKWLSCIRVGGTFCTVGAPEKPMQISAFSLIFAQLNFTASLIGSRAEIEEMLEFSAKHNIRPVIQKMPMRDVNKGIQSVRDGSVRFRVVLENSAPGQE